MIAIHKLPGNSPYEIVKVLSKEYGATLIQLMDSPPFCANGILIEVNDITIRTLDLLTPIEQYDWLKSVKTFI